MNGFKDLTQEKAFNEVKEMLKGSYYGKDNFDRLSFFFITCRSEVTGCAYLNVNNDNVIEYLIVNPKHFGKGVEKGLFSLIYNRAKALNIGEIKVDLEKTNIAITNIGSVKNSLALTQTRVENQQMTIEELKSDNEDRDISDIIIDYYASYNAYQSSLTAAGKLGQSSLLDYI